MPAMEVPKMPAILSKVSIKVSMDSQMFHEEILSIRNFY